MSKKHVDNYFKEICENYHDMIEALKDLEDEANRGLVDPDRIEMMKASIEPLKQNYLRISYIMYLLNKPNRKEKIKKYERMSMKSLSFIGKENTLEGIKEENKKIIKSINI